VNESPQPARPSRGLDHQIQQAHSGADHPQFKTPEQLIAQDKTVADVCRVIEVTLPTFYRWRQLYGGMQAEEARGASRQVV